METNAALDVNALHDKPTRTNEVYEQIIDILIRGELRPGDVIVERRMAERLNASRTPVREALGRLEAERMVLEKADAAVDGFISLQKYCFDAVFNAWSTPAGTDLVQGAFDAWMAPGRKTLRDNAERLRGESDL